VTRTATVGGASGDLFISSLELGFGKTLDMSLMPYVMIMMALQLQPGSTCFLSIRACAYCAQFAVNQHQHMFAFSFEVF